MALKVDSDLIHYPNCASHREPCVLVLHTLFRAKGWRQPATPTVKH